MLPNGVPFPFPGDKENISVTHDEKQRDALIDAVATNESRRPLLKRVVSSLSSLAVRKSPPRISITILTNPTKTRTRSVAPICEEEFHSSDARGRSPLSPLPPHTYMIPSLNPARTRSLASIQNSRSSAPSTRRSHSPSHITILSDPAREKQHAEQQGSTQSTQNVFSEALGPMHVPVTTPRSILKKSATDAVKGVEVKVLLPEVVVHGPVSCEAAAETGDHDLGTGMGTETTSHGEILGVPAVNSRSRLDENDVARYYPKEHAAEQIARRLRSMLRTGSRLAVARRKEHARQYRQTVTATAFLSDLLIASRLGAHTYTPTPI